MLGKAHTVRPGLASHQTALFVDWAERLAACEESLRHRIGADRFEQCGTRDHAMDDDQIIAFAIEHLIGPTP